MSVRLTTDRTVVREFTEDDWRGIHEYAQDERVVYFLNWGPNTESETRAFVNRALYHQSEVPRSRYDLVIESKDSGEILGHGNMRVEYPHYGQGELHCIVGRKHWGKGIATEAMQAFLRFGFYDLKLHRVFAVVDPSNVPTARVLEKLGFQREGHLREHKWIKGIWRDSLLYALLEDEWRQTHPEDAARHPAPGATHSS